MQKYAYQNSLLLTADLFKPFVSIQIPLFKKRKVTISSSVSCLVAYFDHGIQAYAVVILILLEMLKIWLIYKINATYEIKEWKESFKTV